MRLHGSYATFTWAVQGGSAVYRSLFGSGLAGTVGGPGDNQVTETYSLTLVSTAGQDQQ
jgi:hypothetical protein